MSFVQFPPVELADETGLLAAGGDLDVETLYTAYTQGIFPWPVFSGDLLTWFAPSQRCVLYLEHFHPSTRLLRKQKKKLWSFRINSSFEEVITACSVLPRKGQDGTWITNRMIEAYIALHKAGWCHSIECYRGEKLVGGLYGVAIGKMFAGESMFHTESDASKLTLCFLVDYLKGKGCKWIDCQQNTPLLSSFGAVEITRERFMKELSEAVSVDIQLF